MSDDNADPIILTSELVFPADEIARIGVAIQELTRSLEQRYHEMQRVMQITANVNAGLYLDEILESVYRDFKSIIPYDRIGFSLIEEEGKSVRSRWAKASYNSVHLNQGYAAPLAGSSLELILRSGQPRIINDLESYARKRPASQQTRLMLEEGIRSSLTCPLIANGSPVGFLFFSSRQPNTYIDIHVETFLQIAGQLSVMVEKGRLVAELAAQKAELETKNAELRRLNELKNTFLGMAAHDLRNPLSTIQIAMQILLDSRYELAPEERNEILGDVERQSRYMLDLLNDMLDVSHIESGKLTLNPAAIEIGPFLQELVQRHHRLAESKGSSVQLEFVSDGAALGDPMRLRQILDNLISNAVKYSPSGSTTRVRAERKDGRWLLEVQDQGPGLSEVDQQRLFQDFARLSARPTGGEKSTGLGLAITRRMVEAHGGQIGVRSTLGQGATFWFTLPAIE
ncbi:MAG: GAF domain-containing sensor histidine kinase [Anaerolineae bacterium]